MDTLTCKTTQEHYDKAEKMAQDFKAIGVDVAGQVKMIVPDLEKLQRVFERDPNLNTICLQRWDSWFGVNKYWSKAAGYPYLGMADSVCMLKHVAIYWLLEAKPEFVESWKDLVEKTKTLRT